MDFTYSILVFVALATTVNGAAWSYYNGPDGAYPPTEWATHYGDFCDGQRNSPVDIKDTVYKDDLDHTWTFENWESTSGTLKVENTGHAIQNTPSVTRRTSGAGLPGTYQMTQFHLHWGSAVGRGSEHTVDGKQYEAEMHFVHWKTEYGNSTYANGQSDGLAVIGVFLEEDEQDNPHLAHIFNVIDHVTYDANSTDIPAFDLKTLLPEKPEHFYRYLGGLTTPTCDENVVWTVFKNPIKVSTAQLTKLRTMVFISGDVPLINNYRPTQDLHGRVIHRTFGKNDDGGGETGSAVKPILGVMAMLMTVMVHYL